MVRILEALKWLISLRNIRDYMPSDTAPIYVLYMTLHLYVHTYTNNQHLMILRISLEYYIKPTAIFTGEVVRTENKVIGVRFCQK